MNIRNLYLENFKAFENLGELKDNTKVPIEIKPITILCGANSSGKSSIIQSILLLKQTIESGQNIPGLRFNGPFVNLENYENIVFSKDSSSNITLNLTAADDEKKYSFSFRLKQNSKDNNAQITSFKAEWINKRLEIDSKIKISRIISGRFRVRYKGIKDVHDSWEDKKVNMEENIPLSSEKPISYTSKKINAGFLVDGVRFNSLKPALPRDITINAEDRRNIKEKIDNELLLLGDVLDQISKDINYVGPLRAEVDRKYWTEELNNVGTKGEFSTGILNNYYLKNQAQFDNKKYDDPSYKDYLVLNQTLDKYTEFEDGKRNLLDITRSWLALMNIHGLHITSLGQGVGHKTEVDISSNSNKKTSISDIGFGIKQILPILVASLIAEKESSLLLEQPEIHMHPDSQLILADFFICMALAGKNFIIETHSDHLVNRIVRRILEDDLSKNKRNLISLVAIYFIESPSENQIGSKVDKIKISDRGIENWPKGFFDQAGSESLRIVQLISKKDLMEKN